MTAPPDDGAVILPWPPIDQQIILPDGFQFQDSETFRLWTVRGDQIELEGAPSPREVLQEVLEGVLGTGVYVIAYPPEVVTPQAVVIRPADPYQAPYTAAGGRGSAWAFEVDIIVFRNDVDNGLYRLEYFREVICDNLPAGWRWLEFGQVGEIVVAEKVYLKGTLGLAAPYTGGLASTLTQVGGS